MIVPSFLPALPQERQGPNSTSIFWMVALSNLTFLGPVDELISNKSWVKTGFLHMKTVIIYLYNICESIEVLNEIKCLVIEALIMHMSVKVGFQISQLIVVLHEVVLERVDFLLTP